MENIHKSSHIMVYIILYKIYISYPLAMTNTLPWEPSPCNPPAILRWFSMIAQPWSKPLRSLVSTMRYQTTHVICRFKIWAAPELMSFYTMFIFFPVPKPRKNRCGWRLRKTPLKNIWISQLWMIIETQYVSGKKKKKTSKCSNPPEGVLGFFPLWSIHWFRRSEATLCGLAANFCIDVQGLDRSIRIYCLGAKLRQVLWLELWGIYE